MSIWNKVLIGLILVASLAFFYMALRTLRTHKHWREKAQQHEKRIKQIQEDNRQLVEGKGEGKQYQPGIERLRLDLQKMLVGRGRVWRDCKPQPGPQTIQTGQVAVSCDVHGIGEKTVLYLFEQTDPGQSGSYLGKFKVTTFNALDKNSNGSLEPGELPPSLQPHLATADADKNGTLNFAEFDAAKPDYTGPEVLEPSMKMSTAELQRLAASAGKATWTMYEIMPADSHQAFAHLNQDELKKLLPAESVEEYLNDGQLLTTEEVEKMGLRGKVVAVDENGRVMYVDQNAKVLYASVVDENARLVYVDQKGEFAYAVDVQEKKDANGEVVYEPVYLDENGQPVPGTTVVEKELEDGKGKYVRWLRDYDVLLKDCHLQRSILLDLNEAAEQDLAYVVAALTEAEQQQKYRQRQRDLLTTEKQKCQYELTALDELRQKLLREVKACRDAVDRLIAENMTLAAQVEKNQRDAERRIDARTGRMAQSGVEETR